MKTNPVSFKSILVYTIDDGRPKARAGDMIRIAFNNNPDLSPYNIQKTDYDDNDKLDATVYNAMQNYSEYLDIKFAPHLKKYPQDVFLTEAEFYISPKKTQKRYFVTAGDEDKENSIMQVLSRGLTLFTAKFRPKF